MKFRRKAAIIAAVSALPFVALGSYLWLSGVRYGVGTFEAENTFLLGDFVYMLGAPLTLLVWVPYLFFGHVLSVREYWLALPLVNILFMLQWVIWSQLLAKLSEAPRFTRISPRKENPCV